MNVNLNVNSAGPMMSTSPQLKTNKVSSGADAVEFNRATALNQSLENTPDVRPEVVAKGRGLVSMPDYPPAETIRKIASLLAFGL